MSITAKKPIKNKKPKPKLAFRVNSIKENPQGGKRGQKKSARRLGFASPVAQFSR